MRRSTVLYEAASAFGTGAIATCLPSFLTFLEGKGVVIPPSIKDALGWGQGILVAVCLVLLLHVIWQWLREKGLQLGPAILVFVGVGVALAGGVWGAFTWKNPVKARAQLRPPADHATSTPEVLPTHGVVEEIPPIIHHDRAPPTPTKDQRPLGLSRPLAVAGVYLDTAPDPEGRLLNGAEVHLKNTSPDRPVRWKMTEAKVIIEQTDVVDIKSDKYYISPQTMSAKTTIYREGGPVLIKSAKFLTVEFRIEYDEIPPTGPRNIYMKMRFDVASLKDGVFEGDIEEQRED